MRTIVLIGDPVAESVSPAMHRAAFVAEGLEIDYQALQIPPGRLAMAFPRLRRKHLGMNVTRPFKEEVIPLLDDLSDEARRAGSVNTIELRRGRAIGHSTDVPGFLAALERAGTPLPNRAVILGTGGAARAVVAALRGIGAAVMVSGRNASASARLAAQMGGTALAPTAPAIGGALAEADLLVNATPVGGGPNGRGSPLPGGVSLHPGLTVCDLVYRPRRTSLLSTARAAGCRTVEGIEMLIEQGARSFQIWLERRPPIEVMRQAAYRALENRRTDGTADAASPAGA
ncbi:MAG TPA: shikimate dehydrogenase [Actinomycetota bacterium]|nr:shikimate dehydrogenase [Actinomycetota bacterium]